MKLSEEGSDHVLAQKRLIEEELKINQWNMVNKK